MKQGYPTGQPCFLQRGKDCMEWQEAYRLVQQGKACLLDIRSAQEYREQHIPESRHLNFFEISSRTVAQVLPDRSLLVLVYCRSGLHSTTVARQLNASGYRAIDMGAMSDWPWQLEGLWH
ncbi:MAG: rhodanese-like domain-containing protein [Angelakisella sp.]